MERGGRIENLKPWPKGQSGNPKGRPKLPDIKETLAKILERGGEGKTALEDILRALLKKALKGDVRAAQELLDRAYGRAQQHMELKTDFDAMTDQQLDKVIFELNRKIQEQLVGN